MLDSRALLRAGWLVAVRSLLVLLVAAQPAFVLAGEVDPAVQAQLDAMRKMLEQQNEVIRRQSEVIERLERRLDQQGIGAKPVSAPPPAKAAPAKPAAPEGEPFFQPVEQENPIPPISPEQPTLVREREEGVTPEMKDEEGLGGFEAGYEEGFVIRPKDPENPKTPFELRINGRLQFRYTLFERVSDTWVDGTGAVKPIQNRSEFEIERARLMFSGYALSPKIQYFINLDGDTDDNHRLVVHDMWFNYEWNRYANIHVGKAMVPGSRDWLNGSTRTRFADRSLATTFFRPDRSIGVFSTGEPLDNVYYEFMVANGIATSDLETGQIDQNFAYSGTVFWDPWGNYGKGYTDLEWHDEIAALVGTSFTFAPVQGRDVAGDPDQEFFAIRLANGSRIVQDGLFAPDVTVSHLDYYLWAVDAAMKWKGFSANGELFYRWLDDLQGDGAIPVRSVYNYGFYCETGYMFIPERFDFNLRTSQILGQFGYGAEYAAGVNYYVFGTQDVKLSSDITRVVHSPTSNSGPNYESGDNGWLWRVQVQVAF